MTPSSEQGGPGAPRVVPRLLRQGRRGDAVHHPFRFRVACINWSHRDAPHAVAYLMRNGEMVADWFFDTHAEAIAFADDRARRSALTLTGRDLQGGVQQ